MTKFLVVGHGLAGAVLAHTLLERKQDVSVIDTNLGHSASSVSVGLVNPLIGPKLNLPEKMAECIQINKKFFAHYEKIWDQKFYSKIRFNRIFTSEKQKEIWKKKSNQAHYQPYTGELLNVSHYQNMEVNAEFGGGLTLQTYQLQVGDFLEASKEKLENLNAWETNKFKEDSLKSKFKIIFCEGYRVLENPWFNYLPFEPARGEVLKVTGSKSEAISNGSWYLPEKNGDAFMGSTWDHKNLTIGPTNKGKKEIIKNCKFLKLKNYRVSCHLSGVRSGTKDRNPILGVHSKHKNLFLFNGFGSRGTTNIPYYAEKMSDFLLEEKNLPKEANLLRFS